MILSSYGFTAGIDVEWHCVYPAICLGFSYILEFEGMTNDSESVETFDYYDVELLLTFSGASTAVIVIDRDPIPTQMYVSNVSQC